MQDHPDREAALDEQVEDGRDRVEPSLVGDLGQSASGDDDPVGPERAEDVLPARQAIPNVARDCLALPGVACALEGLLGATCLRPGGKQAREQRRAGAVGVLVEGEIDVARRRRRSARGAARSAGRRRATSGGRGAAAHRSAGRPRSARRPPPAILRPRYGHAGRAARRTPRPPRPPPRARRYRRRRPGCRRARTRASGRPPRARAAPGGASRPAARATEPPGRRPSTASRTAPCPTDGTRLTAGRQRSSASRYSAKVVHGHSGGPSPSSARRYACRAACPPGATGAGASPSGLITSVVKPCRIFGVCSGSEKDTSAECACRSISPGQSIAPAPSTTSAASAAARSPTAAITPSRTPTSASTGAPSPG